MKEIKLRAWCEDNKEMYHPDENYEFWIDNNSIGFYPRYDKDSFQGFNTIPAEHEKQIVVMQYTGEEDKNGNEEYEGDIIKVTHDTFDWQHIGVIKYEKGRFFVDCQDYSPDLIHPSHVYEKLGNIYETP